MILLKSHFKNELCYTIIFYPYLLMNFLILLVKFHFKNGTQATSFPGNLNEYQKNCHFLKEIE